MISREDVEHVARLARLALGEAEVERMREQLGGILAYIDSCERSTPPASSRPPTRYRSST